MIPDNQNAGMHPADIQAALRKLGVSQKSLADELEVSKTSITHVIHGQSKSQRIAEYIAQKINRSVDEIWPGRYEKDAKH